MLFCFLVLSDLSAQEGQYEVRTGKPLEAKEANYDWVEDLFQKEDILRLDLHTDFNRLIEQKNDPAYQAGTIVIYHDDAHFTRMHVRLKARGNSRREFCSFPPIKLDFSHPGTELEAVKVLDELKLVTHCREGDAYRDYLFREYLTYRLYNQLTALSFRVRLAKIKYIGPAGQENGEHYAFLIEEVDHLARRNNGREVDPESIGPREVDQRQLSLVSVFQFMIGNLDWSVSGLHNLKLIQFDEALYPVPYDFDYAGIVGTLRGSGETAADIPGPSLRRVYQGYCIPRDDFDDVLDRFRAEQTEMIAEVKAFNRITSVDQEEILELLDSFFRIIENPNQVESYFIRNCRE